MHTEVPKARTTTEILEPAEAGQDMATYYATEIDGKAGKFHCPVMGPGRFSVVRLRQWVGKAGARIVLVRWSDGE